MAYIYHVDFASLIPFNMLLSSVCQYFVRIFISVFIRDIIPIISFSCGGFIWLWYQDDAAYNMSFKVFLLFCFFEEKFKKDLYYSLII